MTEYYFATISLIKITETFKKIYLNIPEPNKGIIYHLVTRFQETGSVHLSIQRN